VDLPIVNRKFHILVGFFFMLALLAPKALADSRTDYLIDLLKNSGNYRVKVQSAKTLGQIGTSAKDDERKKIVEALIEACSDKNELVRMTAAASLGGIGDPAALPTLEKLKSDKVKEVKEQAKDSLKKIEAIQKSMAGGTGTTPTIGSDSDIVENQEAAKVEDAFYIGVGTWSDKSGFDKYDTKNYVKSTLTSLLDSVPGVRIKPEDEPKKETEKVVKKDKLVPYTLTGSIGKVNISDKNSASAEISIIVLDVDGNVTMMLKGKGSASLEGSKKSSKDNEKELVLSALSTAVKGAVEPFSSQLQKSLKPSTKKTGKNKDKKKKKKDK
jgi:hypothetical protein